MKRVVSILLILVTAFYVLPVSDGFLADTETSCKYSDKHSDDGTDAKKDNGKEFISGAIVLSCTQKHRLVNPVLPVLSPLPVHFTIETPPPDQA